MRNIVGSRLPSFTKEQAQKLQGSLDFIGINHYVTRYCFDVPRKGELVSRDYAQDMSIGTAGFSEPNNSSISLSKALNDQFRMDLHQEVLQYVLAAIRNGSDICGYFIWSFLDDFEVLSGYTWRFGLHYVDLNDFEVLSIYTWRFGLHYVDFNDNLKRYPKLSAHWYKSFL
eukprot:PITA_09326